jgi:hypothetical protein
MIDDTITPTNFCDSALQAPLGILADATLSNVRTWHFAPSVNQQLTVSYTYSMKGHPAEQPKEKVRVSRVLDVILTVRPPVLDE